MMAARRSKAPAFFAVFLIFSLFIFACFGTVRAQDEDCGTLREENRKLANALADATLNGNSGGGSCEGMEDLKAQNESLRDTIKAQNEVMAAGGNTNASVEIQKLRNENEALLGLKETVRELQAQNEHLSAAGNMGKTITNQVMALQQRIDELKQVIEKEKQNTKLYREKLKEAEASLVGKKGGAACEAAPSDCDAEKLALNKDITALQLENQELRARIDLLNEKGGK